MSFLGIVACQVGTAFAARTDHAALRDVGLLTNRLLLWGIAFELVFAAAIVCLPGVSTVLGMAVPPRLSWPCSRSSPGRLGCRRAAQVGLAPASSGPSEANVTLDGRAG